MCEESTVIQVPYHNTFISVRLLPVNLLGVVEPNDVSNPESVRSIIEQSLLHPDGDENFYEFMQRPGPLLVIVNDGTRPTPTRLIIDHIVSSLDKSDVTYIIATGVHRAPTDQEYRYIFGSHYEPCKSKIVVHDARKAEDMVYLGASKNGTEMYVNKLVMQVDKILVIGSVEPHYFAGYTGGRKGILPGIASYKTIEQNHKLALDVRAKALSLEGNPVHEDMIDALSVLDKPIYSIMTVLDKNHDVYHVTSGNIHKAFYAAIEKAEEVFVARITKKADIVVTVAKYPMDVDLYQAQKAIDNAKLALKPGGTMILVAACREGLGEQAFIDLLTSSSSPSEVLDRIKGTYKLGYHKAGKMAELFQWANVFAFTELEDDLLRRIFIQPSHSLQNTIDNAVEAIGKEAKVLFLMDGCVTVPVICTKP